MRFALVIELRRNRILAAWSGKRSGSIDEPISKELQGQDRITKIRQILADNDVPSGKCLVVIPRREAVLVRIELDTPEGASISDLHGMARIQLAAQTTIDSDSCVMDVMHISGTTYAVCAASGELSDRIRGELKQAGLSVTAMTTRACGLGLLHNQRRHELVIIAGEREVELVVFAGGIPVVTRQLNRNGNQEADIAKIVSEAHRTETSIRLLGSSDKIESLFVTAHRSIAQPLALALKAEFEIPIESHHNTTAYSPEILPLGLLSESDQPPLLHLRVVRAPVGLHVPAIRLRLGLIALFTIVLAAGALLLSQQKSAVTDQVNKLRTELGKMQGQNREHQREEARIIHLQQWSDSDPLWTLRYSQLADLLPDEGVVLDRISGTSSKTISFKAVRSSERRRYAGGTWSLDDSLSFDIHASVTDRTLVQEFRQRLIDDPRFEVDSKGPELFDRLVFRVLVQNPSAVMSNESEATQ